MVEDCDTGAPEVVAHAEHMFGEFDQSDFLVVGKGEHSKILPTPTN